MIQRISNIISHWLPTAFVICMLVAFGFVAVQQSYRNGLNDPQIAMVQEAQAKLNNGAQPSDLIPANSPVVDLASSELPFLAIYDASGTPLVSSGKVGSDMAKPPVGVFERAKSRGENRVTWQPMRGTRIALVIRPVGNSQGWFVAAGRNMAEVENRVEQLGKMGVVVLIFTLAGSLFLEIIGDEWRRRNLLAGKNRK